MVFGVNSIYISMAIYLNSLGCLLAWFIFFLVIVQYAVVKEEKRLANDFGSDYVKYKEQTPRIIPIFTKKLIPKLLDVIPK